MLHLHGCKTRCRCLVRILRDGIGEANFLACAWRVTRLCYTRLADRGGEHPRCRDAATPTSDDRVYLGIPPTDSDRRVGSAGRSGPGHVSRGHHARLDTLDLKARDAPEQRDQGTGEVEDSERQKDRGGDAEGGRHVRAA